MAVVIDVERRVGIARGGRYATNGEIYAYL
jgi:hypothetical protein